MYIKAYVGFLKNPERNEIMIETQTPLGEHKKTDKAYESPQSVILPFSVDKEYFIEDIGEVAKRPIYNFFKRAIDIVASGIAIVVLAIPMLIIAIIIRLTSKGGALYYQERLGLNGEKFNIIKFRSMVADAEKNGAQWSEGFEDNRITPVGRVLRKFRLDELPQLFCIFTGSMTIVGPRPERECFYEEFEKYIHGFKQRLKVKPGLTGHAQINGGYDLAPHEKIVFDMEYIQKRSLWLDIVIIFKTVAIVFSHEGAK